MNTAFDDLYAEYAGRINRENVDIDMTNLRESYREDWRQKLSDMVAIGSVVSSLNFDGGLNLDALTPQMQESFHLAFPNLKLDDLSSYAGDELRGLVESWKGKLFEVTVRDRLNDGDWVGGYHLEPGQHAVLADLSNQPGYDLIVQNHDGSVVDLVQLKATESLSYVQHAMDVYPQYDVLTTSELGHHVHAGMHVSDISDEHLDLVLTHSVHDATDRGLGLFGFGLPVIPFVLNAYLVSTGQKALKDATGSVFASAVGIAAAGVVAEATTNVITDHVVGHALATVLDFGLPFGTGLLVRMAAKSLWDTVFGSHERENQRRELERAREAARKAAIDTTWRHVNEMYEQAEAGLNRIGQRYRLPAPEVSMV
jgi:hypothetical protein